MRHLIKTILLLLALSFVGAGVPFYTDTIDLNREYGADDSTPSSLSMHYSLRQIDGSHYEIDLWADVTSEQAEELASHSAAFNIQVTSNDELVVDLTDDFNQWQLLSSDETATEFRIANTINLQQESFNLPDGQYHLLILPAEAEDLFNESLDLPSIPITFTSITEYQPAQTSLPPGTTALRLYFPDESSRILIPVTRFVPQTNTTLRETVTQLENGPSPDLGLFNRSPIPPVPRIQLSGGTASLYLSSQLGFYNEYQNVARMAVFSLVESLGHIPEVSRIQFYFDNRILAEGFRDIPTDAPIEPAEPPFIYSAFRTASGRALLMPRPAGNPLISIPEIFQALTIHATDYSYGYSLQPAVPNEIQLLDYWLEDAVLYLNLNAYTNRLFMENPIRGSLMLDALVLSLTSLEPVDAVQLLVEGSPPSVSREPSLAEPLTAPAYINPE